MKSGHSYSSANGLQLNTTPMIISAALLGAAGIIGIAGMIVGGATLISATQKWINDQDVPPSELMKHKWHQTKAATAAGASAWQHHDGMHRAHA
jgi:hypothetical protein